jgi:hypothetical protein
MRESQLTADLHKHLRNLEKSWEIIKHSDRFTSGIPDTSVNTPLNRTVWMEVKEFSKHSQVLSLPSTWCDNLLQVEMLIRTNGIFYVYDPFDDHAALVRPSVVKLAYPNKDTLILSHDFMMWKGKAFDKVHKFLTLTLKGDTYVGIRNL